MNKLFLYSLTFFIAWVIVLVLANQYDLRIWVIAVMFSIMLGLLCFVSNEVI